MAAYIVQRLLQMIVVVIGVMLMVFFIINLTGDPVRLMMPFEASEEDVEALRQQLGFDRPLPVQFLIFMGNAVRGDFGVSLYFRGQPALPLVIERLPATLQLTFATLFWSLPAAILLGTIAAVRRATPIDNLAMFIALLGQSFPSFWLGLMLILIFSVQFGLLPTSGRGDLSHLVLPAITLGAFFMARTTRLVRSSMIDVLHQDYITTARAKGAPEWRLLPGHAMKNAAIPIITLIGLDIGILLGGAVVTETIFAWPGIGRLAVESIINRDFPVVMAVVFVIAILFVTINFGVDILYTWLDPRVKVHDD